MYRVQTCELVFFFYSYFNNKSANLTVHYWISCCDQQLKLYQVAANNYKENCEIDDMTIQSCYDLNSSSHLMFIKCSIGVEGNGTMQKCSVILQQEMEGRQSYKGDKMVLFTLINRGLTMRKDLEISIVWPQGHKLPNQDWTVGTESWFSA